MVDLEKKARVTALEILETGKAFLAMHDQPVYRELLLGSHVRDALIIIFQKEGYSAIVKQLMELPEVIDYELKSESQVEDGSILSGTGESSDGSSTSGTCKETIDPPGC